MSQPVIHLYGFPVSQPTRSVLHLLKAADVPHEFHIVDIMKGEHKQEPYISKNPAGTVPMIMDGDFKLAEGAAMLAYIAETRNLTSYYPTDVKTRATINYWLHWHHTATRKGTPGFLFPCLGLSTVDEGIRQGYIRALEFLNKQLEGKQFVAGTSAPTIADLFILPELDQLSSDVFDQVDFSPYPNIVAYLERLRSAVPHYDEVIAPAKGVAASLKEMK